MQDMTDILCCPEILDDMVQVAMIAFGAGEGHSCHDVGSALGEIEEDVQESEVTVVVCGLRWRIGVLEERRIGANRLVRRILERRIKKLGEELGLSDGYCAVGVVSKVKSEKAGSVPIQGDLVVLAYIGDY